MSDDQLMLLQMQSQIARAREESRKRNAVICGNRDRLHEAVFVDCARLLLALDGADPALFSDDNALRATIAEKLGLGSLPWTAEQQRSRYCVNVEYARFRARLAAMQQLVLDWIDAAKERE